MARRKLEELNLLDDFLIATILSHSLYGEKFARIILKIIFKREFGELNIITQKTYPGSDTDLHGARLDVYLEEAVNQEQSEENALDKAVREAEIESWERTHIEIPEEGTIIDLEPNQKKDAEYEKLLPKRVRFYHAKIDAKALDSGKSYQELKNVTVVVFTPYDPYGAELMKYTAKNQLKEVQEDWYEDGARTLFFNTKGKIRNVDDDIHQLLRYMELSTEENATTKELKELHRIVVAAKHDEEVSVKMIEALERERYWRQQGRREGIKEGQAIERVNTERERQRANQYQKELMTSQKETEYWKNRALGIC